VHEPATGDAIAVAVNAVVLPVRDANVLQAYAPSSDRL
jgi:hypothetical protein